MCSGEEQGGIVTELLSWKTRIAILWMIEAEGMSVYVFLLFLKPGIVQGIMAGNLGGWPITQGLGFFFAIFWWIPFAMAFLSLTLKDPPNQWTNLVMGMLIAIFCVIGLIESAIKGFPAAIPVDYFIGVLAGALIAWCAWKWPRHTA
jgi:hypothetical protein